MIEIKIERLKTVLLSFLMIASVVQIGIHWTLQAQGFPFRFITSIFNTDDKFVSMDVNTIENRYFVPEAIIVSIEPTTPRWKLDQSDSYFKSIWKDIKENYLPAMIKQKPSKIFSKDQWSSLTSVSCIRIDFTANWPTNIIYWLSNMDSRDLSGFDSVKSIAILPQADVNETVNTVYIYDENQVYQYQVNIRKNFLPKNFYKKIADELRDQRKPGLSILSAVTNYESPDDILVSFNKGQGSDYATLKAEIPPSISLNISNIESIQDKILLNQKNSLMAKYNESTNEAIFTDTENLYKLFNDGVLEYKYLPANSAQVGDPSAAFGQAVSFIERRRNLLGNVELVLTDFNKVDNYYEMQFGYKYDGVHIYFLGASLNDRLTSPLKIKANAERVLECQWVIKSFSEIGKLKTYSLYFGDLINDQILSLYPEILERERKYFERIEPGYVFGLNDQGDLSIKPEWIISTDLKDYFIPLLEEED